MSTSWEPSSTTPSSGPGTPRRICEERSRSEPGTPDVETLVVIVMGSDSDWPVMRAAAEALDEFEVPYEADVVSAHRMPHEMIEYGSSAERRGLRVIIAGAGGRQPQPATTARRSTKE